VIVLVANDLGPLPETIRSRCQPVPFRRLSEKAVREEIAGRAPELSPEEQTAIARVAAGRLDRATRLLDPAAAKRRATLIEVARSVYLDPAFDAASAAASLIDGASERGAEAKDIADAQVRLLDLTERESEQRLRRAQRGAEREELLAALEELAAWYRDLVVVAAGAEPAVIHFDRLAELSVDGTRERMLGAERACELTRATWRAFEEFQLNPSLALEALFVQLQAELGGRSLAASSV
jgi:DNA polymerase-3 subunit delta'